MPLNTDSQKRSSPGAADNNDHPTKKSRSDDMMMDEDPLPPTGGSLNYRSPSSSIQRVYSEPGPFVQLNCLVYGDDIQHIFVVRIEAFQTVAELKDAIKEKNKPLLDRIPADTLDLWKVSLPIGDYSQEMPDGEPLLSVKKLSTVFPEPPVLEHIHIIVKVPAFAPGDNVGPWLAEVYAKIWKGGDQCLKSLVHKVTVTLAHYRELQKRLAEPHPKQDAIFDSDKDIVASIKRDILLAYKPNPNTQIPANDDDQELEPNEESDDDPELDSFLPTTFEFLDLSSLGLNHKQPRLPLPLFIRSEYNIFYEDIRRQKVNIYRSQMISGQPGIGKTAFLHYMMIKYMIDGLPFLYQTISGNVYYVSSDGVNMIAQWEPRNIVAFVDTDPINGENTPKLFLHQSCVQFIMASSPKGVKQKWMKQINSSMFERMMNLWAPHEFYVTGIFLHSHRLDFADLRESVLYFGFNPRYTFLACKSGRGWKYYQDYIINAIKSIKPRDVSLHDFMRGTITTLDILSHIVFQILPLNDNRYLSQAQVQAVSPWVMKQLLEYYKECDANAAAEFYAMTMGVPRAGPLRGDMFRLGVLKYFDHIDRPTVFKIRNLDTSEYLNWTYPGPACRETFQSQSLPTLFKEFVEAKKARHMVPLISNFAAVDSILYDPASVLTGFQVTIKRDHPVAVSGLQLIQKSLKRNNTKLNDLRPTTAKCWRLIFVVPTSMAADFPQQNFEGVAAGNWAEKVEQYVLGLEEKEVWKKYMSDLPAK